MLNTCMVNIPMNTFMHVGISYIFMHLIYARTQARTQAGTHTHARTPTIFEVFVVTHDLPGAPAVAQIVVDVRSFVVVQRVRVICVIVTERPHLQR